MAVVVGKTLWQFANQFSLGESAPGGGNTICINGGIVWIVSPASSQVLRNWYCRDDAVTTATNCTTATGWFVPTCGQLKNPGNCCRTYWGGYTFNNGYWSSTEINSSTAYWVYLDFGNAYSSSKTSSRNVRAFRCVTY